MRYHFVAIGGSAMHNLAIALHKKGDTVTGSDDEIFEPSKSRLAKYGLLPEKTGWFPDKIEKGGTLIYFESDENLKKAVTGSRDDIEKIQYNTHKYLIKDGITYLQHGNKQTPIKIFGNHNLQNISGAKHVCLKLGISEDDFYKSISTFEGAAKRLQLLAQNSNTVVYLDFAHSPSKLKATVDAVKQQYPDKKIVACMELHTYSSLSKEFLQQYKGTMNSADTAIIFFSNHALELKKLEKLNKETVAESFDKQGIIVFDDKDELKKQLFFMDLSGTVLLLLSSGNFEGLKLTELAKELVENC